MLRRLGQILSLVALFAICGGHWAILQTVAWTQMLRDYSKESGLVIGIQQTFSGERPCTMCKTITNERQKESQLPASVNLAKKFEILMAVGLVFLTKPVGRKFAYPAPQSSIFSLLTFAPPSPVPRSAIA